MTKEKANPQSPEEMAIRKYSGIPDARRYAGTADGADGHRNA